MQNLRAGKYGNKKCQVSCWYTINFYRLIFWNWFYCHLNIWSENSLIFNSNINLNSRVLLLFILRCVCFSFDVEKQHASITIGIPSCTLLADYDISGRILILPISGHGPSNITFSKFFSHSFTILCFCPYKLNFFKQPKSNQMFQ